jgi:hypothetical protein
MTMHTAWNPPAPSAPAKNERWSDWLRRVAPATTKNDDATSITRELLGTALWGQLEKPWPHDPLQTVVTTENIEYCLGLLRGQWYGDVIALENLLVAESFGPFDLRVRAPEIPAHIAPELGEETWHEWFHRAMPVVATTSGNENLVPGGMAYEAIVEAAMAALAWDEWKEDSGYFLRRSPYRSPITHAAWDTFLSLPIVRRHFPRFVSPAPCECAAEWLERTRGEGEPLAEALYDGYIYDRRSRPSPGEVVAGLLQTTVGVPHLSVAALRLLCSLIREGWIGPIHLPHMYAIPE